MAYVNVADWKSDQVADWLKGKLKLNLITSINNQNKSTNILNMLLNRFR